MKLQEFNKFIHSHNKINMIVLELSDLVDKKTFIDTFGHYELEYSIGGNSSYTAGGMTLREDPLDKYIFHNTVGTTLFKILSEVIPPPNLGEIIKSRIYSGKINTGTHVHFHNTAINYLIEGSKLWFIFPPTSKNDKIYTENMLYGSVQEDTIVWFNKNLEFLKAHIENYSLFIQEKSTAVYIPNGYYHAVINLSDVLGITYSWK